MTGRRTSGQRSAAAGTELTPGFDWQQRAECLGQDPEMFFPVGDTGSAQRQLLAAKQVCTQCPVVEACLEWAVRAGIDHGVWGGLSESERRTLRRRARRGSAV